IRLEGQGAIGNTSQTEAPNVISGNGGNGIEALKSVSIHDSYIGTTADGLHALPNDGNGIQLDNVGTFSIERSVVSGNKQSGIKVNNAISSQIAGSLIGLGTDGATPLGNGGDGILM